MPIFTSSSSIVGAPGYPERSGQQVTVLRPLRLGDDPSADADMEVGPMFRVRFTDGAEADAYDDELSPPPPHPQQAQFDAYMAS